MPEARPQVVSNTGPLIALASIDQIGLLRTLFGTIYIPAAVRAEVLDDLTVNAVRSADWIRVLDAKDQIAVQILQGELDAGETEAIILAREINADLLLIDDRAARRRANAINLTTLGTLGVLVMAKKQGAILSIRPLLDGLRQANFHMSDDLYHRVLESAGEQD